MSDDVETNSGSDESWINARRLWSILTLKVLKRQSLLEQASLTIIRPLAGKEFDEMYNEPTKIAQYFSNRDSNIRQAALRFVIDFFHVQTNFVNELIDIALCDTDCEVRTVAIRGLGCVRNHEQKRIERLLASIVRNGDEDNKIRLAAYRALISQKRLSLVWKPPVIHLRFPDDVDWDFVCSFDKDASLDSGLTRWRWFWNYFVGN